MDDGPLVPQPELELQLLVHLPSERQPAAAPELEPELEPEPSLQPEPSPQPPPPPPPPQPQLEPEPEPEPESFDRYGLTMDCEHAEVYTREVEEEAKEAERQAKWAKMFGNWELYAGEGATSRRAAKLKRRVRKGIPVEQRGRAWFMLCGARDQMEQNPGVYHDLAVVQPCPESYENQIKLDISRTITDHRFFRETTGGKKEGQQVLYRVLRAYAVYNHKVAYCQGMSYIAGMFLCQGVDEEEGFWMMRQFMNGTKYNLCGLFEDGFPLMNQYLDTLSVLLFEKYPAEAHHIINRENVVPIMFAEKWMLTLFMYTLQGNIYTSAESTNLPLFLVYIVTYILCGSGTTGRIRSRCVCGTSSLRRVPLHSSRLRCQVSFQWKNPDFISRNPDFLSRNPDFQLKNVDFTFKNKTQCLS